LRRKILDGKGLKELVYDLVEEAIVSSTMKACPEKAPPSEWKLKDIENDMMETLGVAVDLVGVRDRDDIMNKCFQAAERYYDAKEKSLGPDLARQIESYLYLQVIDEAWKQHLSTMDHLREGIHLRSYGQKDPKQEYKKEGFNLFVGMKARVRDETLDKVFKAQVVRREEGEAELLRLQAEREARRAASRKVNQRANTRSVMAPPPKAPSPAAAPIPAASPSVASPTMSSTASGSYSLSSSSSVAGSFVGAVTSTTSSSGGAPSAPTASTPVARSNGAVAAAHKPLSSLPPRPSLREELAKAAEDDTTSNNRAERRRQEAQKRKDGRRR
jgi:hypothetical protein